MLMRSSTATKIRRYQSSLCTQSVRKLHSAPILPNSSKQEVVFSGIQPTGVPHLGNYLGALQRWVHIQNESHADRACYFSVVDLHALTARPERELLTRWRRETFASLLAVGLDPSKSTIFMQSDVRPSLQIFKSAAEANNISKVSYHT